MVLLTFINFIIFIYLFILVGAGRIHISDSGTISLSISGGSISMSVLLGELYMGTVSMSLICCYR